MKINNQNFKKEVLESDMPVMVDFYSDWCGPCQMLGPIIEELAKEYQGKIKIGKLNVEDGAEIAQQYEVRSIPALIFFKNGREIKRLVGFQDKKNLAKEIDSTFNL